MKLTNKGMLEAIDTLNRFGDVTGKIGYAVMKTRRKIAKELEDYEAQRVALVKKYGKTVKNPDTGEDETRVPEDSENYKPFIEEIVELLNMENEVDVYKLPVEELEDIPYVATARASDYDVLEQLLGGKDGQ